MKMLLLALFFSTAAFAEAKLLGAGATFPYPLYSKWFQEYQKQKPSVRFNYQPIGSGGGVKQLSMSLVDFGASDVQLTPEEKKLFSSAVLEIPMTIGGVVLAYNLNGISDLKLSRTVLGQIFSGKITRWDHEAIRKDNQDKDLPSTTIKVVARADASGTTAVFTQYLSMLSSEFGKKVGAGKAVSWPMMVAKGKGNDGVTALVKATQGGIGYVELAYAVNQGLAMASLENKQGQFIKAGLAGFTKSAELAKPGQYNILDTDHKEAYPISTFSFILLPKVERNKQAKAELKEFLVWSLEDGQKLAAPLHYSALPARLSDELKKAISAF